MLARDRARDAPEMLLPLVHYPMTEIALAPPLPLRAGSRQLDQGARNRSKVQKKGCYPVQASA